MQGRKKNDIPDRQLSGTERVIRDNEKRRRKKRRRDRMIYLILALFVAGTGIVLSLTVFFHIEVINATTDSLYYSADEIIAASGIKTGENMFLQPLSKVSEKIEKTLPYIESAKIKLSLPNKITILTTDAVPALAVEAGEDFFLLSIKGKILGTTGMTVPPDTTAIIKGLTLKEPEAGNTAEFNEEGGFELLMQILDSLEKNELEGVTEINLTDTIDIKIWLEDSIRLDIGSINEIDKKLNFAKPVIEAEAQRKNLNPIYIDVKNLREAHARDITTSEPEEETETTVSETKEDSSQEKTTESETKAKKEEATSEKSRSI